MTSDQYDNYQTPSSRPPEPPYRTDVTVSASQQAAPSQHAATPQQEASVQQPTPAQHAASFTKQQSGHQPDFSGFDTMSNTAQMGTVGAYAQNAGAVGTGQGAAVAARAPKSSSGAGKSFLFGFLGALLACAIALGGFGFFMSSSSNQGSPATPPATTLGTSDSTVINAVEEGLTVSEAVAAKTLPSVVAIYNYADASSVYGYGFGYGYGYGNSGESGELVQTGMGSGVVISDDGYIMTNYHVVENAAKLTVMVGDEERDATFVGGDNSSDVAVIKIENTDGLQAADIGDSDKLVIGEWVMTVGAPLGLEQSVATGVVSATNRSTVLSNEESSYFATGSGTYRYYPNMIQTDAVINPGNSGGALVDSDGKLIGINTMVSSYSGDYAGVGFAIPVNYAMGIAEQVISGKEPTHALLGVSISSVNSSNAKRYNLSVTSGAYIAAINEGTGAAESDLQVGDIITAINGKTVSSSTDVTLDVRENNPGDTVTVTVNRNGEVLEIPVVLTSDENQIDALNNTPQQGWGNGYGDGYTDDQLREFLKMFGI